jgi:hypothetical protein
MFRHGVISLYIFALVNISLTGTFGDTVDSQARVECFDNVSLVTVRPGSGQGSNFTVGGYGKFVVEVFSYYSWRDVFVAFRSVR